MYARTVPSRECAMSPVLFTLLMLSAWPAQADPAVDLAALDVEAERLACHGQPQEPEASHAEACAQAQAASEAGDILGLAGAVEIMRRRDPSGAQACTTRFDDQLAQNPPRQREDYRAGLSAMKAGELERARACFRLGLAEDPYNQLAARRLEEVEAALEPTAPVERSPHEDQPSQRHDGDGPAGGAGALGGAPAGVFAVERP